MPRLLYPNPVLAMPPAVAVQQQPIYLYVPPGHAKRWDKYCHRYNACYQSVYFVEKTGTTTSTCRIITVRAVIPAATMMTGGITMMTIGLNDATMIAIPGAATAETMTGMIMAIMAKGHDRGNRKD
ncbi:hypothetical protein HS096_05395 [candidate division WWE3 bacterium]|uniref:Uncharacterized protein n=1 Tax=candidate division WWE3 bacterium TaxID=2053526 RepID=A0A928TTC4_UNCKA|nr:hypothetical protein [candidate division WWE3 bacterium]